MAAEPKPKSKFTTKIILFLLAIIIIGCIIVTMQDTSSDQQSQSTTGKTMYFCGYDRCRDSGGDGQVISQTCINVWNNPDPNRGGVHHQGSQGNSVKVIREKRVDPGPGGLWYELEGGGWINDLWLTDKHCGSYNLEDYSFTDCLMGEY